MYALRSPVSHWRLDPKFYPQLNFIGHLETAQDDIKRLLDKLHPDAWRKVSTTNESPFHILSRFVYLSCPRLGVHFMLTVHLSMEQVAGASTEMKVCFNHRLPSFMQIKQ